MKKEKEKKETFNYTIVKLYTQLTSKSIHIDGSILAKRLFYRSK